MIARLEERCTYPPTAILAAVVALTAAILALLPGVAEAQEDEQQHQQQQHQQGAAAPATAPAARSAVVAPGDTLWSISQERLGSSATPRQVALDVRRIHEINRNLIGDDPHLIFPGQRLALPPPVGAPAAGRALAPAADARADAGAARGAPEQAARPAAPELAPERAPEPIALPALPEAGAVPEARLRPSRAVPGGVPDVPEDERRRRLLGLGIVALTLVLAGLMAWRLPMRRDVAGDAEAWGLYPGYYHHYHHHGEDRHDHHDADLLAEGKPHPVPAPTSEPARRHEPSRRHEPGRNGAKRSPRKGLAVAHNPSVRRALRPPRTRPVLARGPSRRAARRAARRARRGAVVPLRHPARRRRASGLARGGDR